MTFALATVGCGLPQVLALVLAAVLAFKARRRAPRAARYALAASVIELLLVASDLALLGGADLSRTMTYASEQTLDTFSNILVLLSVLALAPLLYAVQIDRNLRLPSLGKRQRAESAIPPRTRSRWEQVLPGAGEHPGATPPGRHRPPQPPAR